MGMIFRPRWTDRPHKATARDLVLSEISHLKQISYAGLPGPDAIFEKEMLSRYSVSSMALYENVASLFKMLESSSFECDFKLLKADIDSDPLLTSEFFNFIWLDYCGPLTLKRFARFQELAPLVAKREGVLAVTYLAAREPLSFSRSFLPPGSFTEGFLKGPLPLPLYRRVNFLRSSAESMGLNFKLTVQPYADHVPMLLFVFSFSDAFSQNDMTILPYLKDSKHGYQYTIFS